MRKPVDNPRKALIIAEDAKSLLLTRKELILEIIEAGYICEILIPQDHYCDELGEYGCIIKPIIFDRRGMNPIAELNLFKQLKKYIKKGEYEFIITYSIKPNIYGGFAARLAKIPYFINITGLGSALCTTGLIQYIARTLYWFSSPKASGVFFENTENRKQFIRWGLCGENNSYSFSGAGINLNEFKFSPRILSDKMVFLYIGRLMDEKGINELCHVAKRIYSEFPNVEFRLAGGFEDAFKDKFFSEYDSIPNIKYLGYCNDIKEQIKNSDCIIHPSYHEGMANVLLEGGAIGRPLLASDIPGCREAIKNGYNGFTFQVKNEEALFSAVRKFIELPEETRKEYGKNSRYYIEENFDRRNTVRSIMSILGAVSDNHQKLHL